MRLPVVIMLLLGQPLCSQPLHHTVYHGATIRGDTTARQLALVFTGDVFAEGGEHITHTLAEAQVKASFFFTGNFYRNPSFQALITRLRKDTHYLGPHSDRHLLYCDWTRRDSLLVTRPQFEQDLQANYQAMEPWGLSRATSPYFLPPYEWFNDSIAAWTRHLGLTLINYTPGTLSHADYTTEGSKNYRSSDEIWQSVVRQAETGRHGLNGYILLFHIGAGPGRTDKFYNQLPALIAHLKKDGYRLVKIDELLR